MNFAKQPQYRILLPGLTVLLILLLLPMWILQPLTMDQYIYVYLGKTVLNGGIPYVDVWEQKGPLLHLLYAAALFLPMQPELCIRLIDALFTLLTLFLTFKLVSTRGHPATGWIAIILILAFTPLTLVSMAQADSWNAYLGMVLAYLVLGPSTPNLLRAFLAGLVQGATLMIKPTTVFFALAAIAAWFHEKERWRLLISYAAGSLIAPILIISWLGWKGGAFELWNTYILFNLEYHKVSSAAPLWYFFAPGSLLSLVYMAKMFFIAGCIWGWIDLRQQDRALGDTFMALTLASLLAWLAQKHENSVMHMLPIFFFASIPVAALVARRGWPGLLLSPYIVNLFTGIGYNPIGAWQYASGQINHTQYLQQYAFSNYNSREEEILAEKISNRTTPSDRIFVMSFSPAILVIANRQSATRFFFSYPLMI